MLETGFQVLVDYACLKQSKNIQLSSDNLTKYSSYINYNQLKAHPVLSDCTMKDLVMYFFHMICQFNKKLKKMNFKGSQHLILRIQCVAQTSRKQNQTIL